MTENGHHPSDAEIQVKALKVQLASIRKLCEVRWAEKEPCRLCNKTGSHTPYCYVRDSVGYDLLEEHETTLRENDQLRAALARLLPVNGKHIKTGGGYKSIADRVRGRFSSHD